MRTALIAVVLLLRCTAAWADVGVGDFDRSDVNVLHAIRARPLDQIGDDVIRFSTTPSLGGRAWVVELHRQGDQGAVGVATFGFWGRGDWLDLGSLKLSMSIREYDRLSTRVDALLARGEPRQDHGRVVVCADGPAYVTERRNDGHSIWMSGDCGRHPNNVIARLMLAVVWSEACRYQPAVAPCASAEVAKARQ